MPYRSFAVVALVFVLSGVWMIALCGGRGGPGCGTGRRLAKLVGIQCPASPAGTP